MISANKKKLEIVELLQYSVVDEAGFLSFKTSIT